MWQHFGIRAEALVIDPETELGRWRICNWKRLSTYLEGTADVSGLEEE